MPTESCPTDKHRVRIDELSQVSSLRRLATCLHPFGEDASINKRLDRCRCRPIDPVLFPCYIPRRLHLSECLEKGVPDSNSLGLGGEGSGVEAFQDVHQLV